MNIKREETGKYFFDLSKIIFATSVLANISTLDKFYSLLIFLVGFIGTVLFFKIGQSYLSTEENGE